MTDQVPIAALLEAIQRNAKASDSLRVAAEALRDAQGPAPSNGGNSTININMGGWGVALCVAAVMACVYITNAASSQAAELRAEARDLGRKVERREDYLNMLWLRYPELRPEKLQTKPEEKP